MKKRAVLDYKYFTQMSENHEKNYELIVGMQEVRLHNAEIKRRSQWEEIQLKLYHLSIDTLSLKQRQAGGALIINELKNIIITFISVNLVIRDQITLGQLLSISYITGQLNNPILQLIDFFQSLQDARLSISRIEEIHELKPEESKYDNLIKEYSNGDILVKDLWFSYGTAHNYPILQNINLCIPANKTTAIVGSSGSGKTTLLKLLLKIYEPQKGQILIDDFPLDKISHSSWRDNCGVVMQEGFLFNDTVLNNIAVADENPDIKMVIEVAKAANIYDYILELPNGLQTIIGSQGISMSVGQKQRLFIARALYKQPDVLFLDEATSALDAQNEKVITHNLVSMFSGKTIIIVAHRLSTVRHADNIIVLDKGRITEMGNHHQLVEKEGIYYNLVRNQLELGK
jgi:ATP-binding cassette subfamily B protein